LATYITFGSYFAPGYYNATNYQSHKNVYLVPFLFIKRNFTIRKFFKFSINNW